MGDLIKIAEACTRVAKKLIDRCTDALAKNNKTCEKAVAQVMASLDKRRKENSEIRKELIEQKKKVDETISDAGSQLLRLRMQQNAHSSDSDVRKASEEKWAQLQPAQAALAELETTRKQLEDDIQNKTTAMKIDESCKII